MTSVRLHARALREANKVTSRRSIEQLFLKNPWKFAQSVCRPPHKVDPDFSAEQCLQYFEHIASTPAGYSGLPD